MSALVGDKMSTLYRVHPNTSCGFLLRNVLPHYQYINDKSHPNIMVICVDAESVGCLPNKYVIHDVT